MTPLRLLAAVAAFALGGAIGWLSVPQPPAMRLEPPPPPRTCPVERSARVSERAALRKELAALAAQRRECPDPQPLWDEQAALAGQMRNPLAADLGEGGRPFPRGLPRRFTDHDVVEAAARAYASAHAMADAEVRVDCSEYPCVALVIAVLQPNTRQPPGANARGAGPLAPAELSVMAGGASWFGAGATGQVSYATLVPYPPSAGIYQRDSRDDARVRRLEDEVCRGPRGADLCPVR